MKKGHVMDISKARGTLVNLKKPKHTQIGREELMHQAFKWLTEKKDTAPSVIHVYGKKYMGKTAFMTEVAYSLYQRHLFTFKIAY